MATYDSSGNVGTSLAYQQYFRNMEKIQRERKSKEAGRKLGMSSAKGVKEFQQFMSPSSLSVNKASIFQDTAPTGNLFERIGQRLSGPDLSKAKLTEDAIGAGYDISKGSYKPMLGKTTEKSVLKKGGETVSEQFGGPGTKVGGLMGAYQMGSGLATVFDPDASDIRKWAGGANVALGANALLALGGANVWNPLGPIALLGGGVATLADMFG